MPIDMQKEELVTLTEATKILPPVNGKRPAISTLWRWCRKGIKGTRLEYVRVGRNISTSLQALNRFFIALAEADKPLQPPRQVIRNQIRVTERMRQRSLADADRILAEAGL